MLDGEWIENVVQKNKNEKAPKRRLFVLVGLRRNIYYFFFLVSFLMPSRISRASIVGS